MVLILLPGAGGWGGDGGGRGQRGGWVEVGVEIGEFGRGARGQRQLVDRSRG